jgi:hypothetical protein
MQGGSSGDFGFTGPQKKVPIPDGLYHTRVPPLPANLFGLRFTPCFPGNSTQALEFWGLSADMKNQDV